jgi:hypothetical protein
LKPLAGRPRADLVSWPNEKPISGSVLRRESHGGSIPAATAERATATQDGKLYDTPDGEVLLS